MAWFKSKTPEEKAAEEAQDREETLLGQRAYLADRTGIDVRDIRAAYGDEESLSATFNSLSNARENWGWLIAGVVICGVIAAANGVEASMTKNIKDIPYLSSALTLLCAWGVHHMSAKINRIEQAVKDRTGHGGPSPPPPG
jgi:hypothetical protein